MAGKGSSIASGRKNLAEKQVRRNFRLLSKTGQMGKYGVEGPVERSEDKLAGVKPRLKPPKGV